MNVSVVAFAAIMIIGGIISGVNFVIVLGVLLLISGLLASPRKQARIPVSKTPQSRRAPPPPSHSPPSTEPATAAQILAQIPNQPQQPAYASVSATPMPSPALQVGYASALFPTAMFPTLSLPSTYRQQAEPKEKQPPTSERDELLEFGLLIAVLKFVSG